MSSINTHGLTPRTEPYWKLFEIDGFQLLVSWEENEHEDDLWDFVLQTALDRYDVVEARLTCNVEVVVRKLFEDYDEEAARKGLQFVLDNVVNPTFDETPTSSVPDWVATLRGA